MGCIHSRFGNGKAAAATALSLALSLALGLGVGACGGASEEAVLPSNPMVVEDAMQSVTPAPSAETPLLLEVERRALDVRLAQVRSRKGEAVAELKLLYSPRDITYASMKANDPAGLQFLVNAGHLGTEPTKYPERFEAFRKANQLASEAATKDGEAVLLHAVKFAQLGGKGEGAQAEAKEAVEILKAWASTNKMVYRTVSKDDPFKNGWLVSSWAFGAMARGAFLLKSGGSAEYAAVAPAVEAWLDATATAHWKSKPGTKPTGQLDSSWEKQNVSNRSLASLEATLHVARLVGNSAWFKACLDEFAVFAHAYVQPSGVNYDEARDDNWHPYAGIASGFQILRIGEAAKARKVELPAGWESARKELVLSAEFYANPKYENFSRTAMPMWRAAMLGLGGLDAPKTKALYDVVSTSAKEEVAAFGVQFLWGFPGTIR